MAYDEALAERVRRVIGERSPFDEIRMFGGLCFMVNTHMAVGISSRGGLLVKASAGEAEGFVARGAVPAAMGARTMTGMVRVDEEVLERDGLEAWVLPMVEAALDRAPRPSKAQRASRSAGP